MSDTQRDELRGTLGNTICNALNYPPKAVPHLLGGDMSTVLDKTAEALIAAGYRKVVSCTCGEMLRDTSIRCALHPEVRVRTFDERMDFEQAFDARVLEGKQ